MNYSIFLTLAAVILLIIMAINLVRYRKKYAHLHSQQIELDRRSKSVNAQYNELKEKFDQNLSFSKDLNEADKTTTRLQMSRSSYHSRAATASMPERYQYISSLTDKGANAAEIANLFLISKQEADQLVTLSQLNSGCKP